MSLCALNLNILEGSILLKPSKTNKSWWHHKNWVTSSSDIERLLKW